VIVGTESLFLRHAAGAGDQYLQDASGGAGAGGKQVMQNDDARWTGDYSAITYITANLRNEGSTTLSMRLAIEYNDGITQYVSTDPVTLSVGSGWQSARFDLDAAHMSLVPGGGSNSLSTALSGVQELRLLSSLNGLSYMGDVTTSVVGVDNVAVPEPGSLALLAAGAIVFCGAGRRRL
jgi:hypothetical protein